MTKTYKQVNKIVPFIVLMSYFGGKEKSQFTTGHLYTIKESNAVDKSIL